LGTFPRTFGFLSRIIPAEITCVKRASMLEFHPVSRPLDKHSASTEQ
jgi:hypothetical protein